MEATITEWEALDILLAANAERPLTDALTDGEFVRLTLQFLNAPTLANAARLLVHSPMPGLKLEPSPEQLQAHFGGISLERWRQGATEALAKEIELERDQIRADLKAIVEGSLSPQALARLTASASRQAQLPVFDFEGGALRRRYRHRAASLAAKLDYAAILILLEPKLQRDLCLCRRDDCGNFFLADRRTGGRPRTEFCSPEHMKEQHDADGVLRADKSRKQRAQKTKRARHK
jgi:hypothetical protein